MCENSITTEVLDEQPERKFKINNIDMLFSALFFLAAFLMSALGVFGNFRGGFTLAATVLTAVITLYLFGNKNKINIFPILCIVASFGVSLSFLFTSNSSVRFWSFVTYFLLNLTWFTALTRKETDKSELGILKFIFFPFFKDMFANIPHSLVALFSGSRGKNKTLLKVLLGIAISIPLLFIVMPLLLASDVAFKGMIGSIFKNFGEVIYKLIFASIIFVFVLSYSFSLKKTSSEITKSYEFKGIEPIIVISFLSVFTVIYVSYLFSQLAYFFSAFSGFLPNNYEFTVSTYARRGFFEMAVIAAINFLIIYLAMLLTSKENSKLTIITNILCTFIGIFTLIIITTAISKMVLYIGSFGMTIKRITTSMFMLFLAVVFISLLIRLYYKKVNVIKTAFITAAVVLTLLGTVNVNALVANYNYNGYKSGDLAEIDVNTIADMGDEGIPILVKLAISKNEEITEKARLNLSYAYKDYYKLIYDEYDMLTIKKKNYSSLGEFSISRQKAYKALDGYIEEDPYILEFSDEYYENLNNIY